MLKEYKQNLPTHPPTIKKNTKKDNKQQQQLNTIYTHKMDIYKRKKIHKLDTNNSNSRKFLIRILKCKINA